MRSNLWEKLDRRRLTQQYLYFLLRHRFGVCVFILLGTLFFGYQVSRLRVHTDFFDLYPPKHPYIQLYQQYRQMFGTANVLQFVLEVQEGDIYTVAALKKIDGLTRALMDTRGVNPFQVTSLTHPRVKNIVLSSAGISALPLVKRAPESPEELQAIREAVYANVGVRGVHVSLDGKAALITAGLWEEGTDFRYLWARVNELLTTYQDANTRLYVTGYPMLYTWVHHYYPTILLIIGLTTVVIALLLWFYFRTLIGVFVPLLSGLLSALWALGFVPSSALTSIPWCWWCSCSSPRAPFLTRCSRWSAIMKNTLGYRTVTMPLSPRTLVCLTRLRSPLPPMPWPF